MQRHADFKEHGMKMKWQELNSGQSVGCDEGS